MKIKLENERLIPYPEVSSISKEQIDSMVVVPFYVIA